MRNALQIEIPLLTLFESPTIAELAKKVEEMSGRNITAPRFSRVSREICCRYLLHSGVCGFSISYNRAAPRTTWLPR